MLTRNLDITFRTDRRTKRPRINKLNGSRDREQKKNGEYYKVNR